MRFSVTIQHPIWLLGYFFSYLKTYHRFVYINNQNCGYKGYLVIFILSQ